MKLFSSRLLDAKIETRAPKGKMYNIKAISFSSIFITSATIYVLGRKTSSAVTDSIDHTDDVIGAMSIAVGEGGNHFINNIDEKRKYLTIAKDTAGAVSCVVTVYGELVRATREELIIDWFYRGYKGGGLRR